MTVDLLWKPQIKQTMNVSVLAGDSCNNMSLNNWNHLNNNFFCELCLSVLETFRLNYQNMEKTNNVSFHDYCITTVTWGILHSKDRYRMRFFRMTRLPELGNFAIPTLLLNASISHLASRTNCKTLLLLEPQNHLHSQYKKKLGVELEVFI